MKRAGLVYFLMNAPLSTVSSSLPGVSILIATIYLNYIGEPERAGELRLYLSYFALLALLFMTESAKLVIRAVIREERGHIAELVGLRVWISVALLLAGVVAFVLLEADVISNAALLVIPVISALYYPSELYTPVLQATQRFRLLTLLNLAKHTISTSFLLIAIWHDADMLVSFAGYMLLNAAIGFIYALAVTEIFRGVPRKVRRMEIFTPPVREAFVLTVANAVPYSLEHIDKLIVSALFGNAVLGVYSLGFSVGRLLYSLLKPTIFIYYYRFVTALPAIGTLAACFVGGTALGGAISFAMREFAETPQFAFFAPALLVNAIVLWSYGVGLVNTIYTQAVMINENSRAGLVLVANVIGGFVCLAMFGVSTLTDYRTSLALLAAHFPVRHLVSFAIIWFGVRKTMMDKQGRSASGAGLVNGAIVRDRIIAKILRVIDDCAPKDRRLKVLEAGGGSTTRVAIPREHDIVTVDISADQLERNTYATERILADLEDFTGHDGRYDLVICWNVLEHVSRPSLAFHNMRRSLTAGGYMLIACPCPFSLKGVITKFSPHFFHVWYYRKVRGDRRAGRPGHFPFRTHLRREIALPALSRQSIEAGLEVVVAEYYTAPAIDELRHQSRLLHAAYSTLSRAARAASFGTYRPDDTDYLLLVRKPAENPA